MLQAAPFDIVIVVPLVISRGPKLPQLVFVGIVMFSEIVFLFAFITP